MRGPVHSSQNHRNPDSPHLANQELENHLPILTYSNSTSAHRPPKFIVFSAMQPIILQGRQAFSDFRLTALTNALNKGLVSGGTTAVSSAALEPTTPDPIASIDAVECYFIESKGPLDDTLPSAHSPCSKPQGTSPAARTAASSSPRAKAPSPLGQARPPISSTTAP